MTLASLVYSRCTVTATGCVEWMGGLTGSGYGNLQLSNGEQHSTHIVTWEEVNGPVPEGLVLDHVGCSNKRCCRVQHLEPKPRGENILRDSPMPNHVTYRTNVCHQGHSMEDAYIRGNGRRMCRPCSIERTRARTQRLKEERLRELPE